MKEEIFRKRFHEIAKKHLDYDLDYEESFDLPLTDLDTIRRKIITLASERNISLGVNIHVEMIDMVLWFWENMLKVPKKSIMSLFTGYSFYVEEDYNVHGLLPEEGLLDRLTEIDEDRGLLETEEFQIVKNFRAYKKSKKNKCESNVLSSAIYEELKLFQNSKIDFDWIGYQAQLFDDDCFLTLCSKSYSEAARILNKSKCGWMGQPFSLLIHGRKAGYTGFYIQNEVDYEPGIVDQLLKIDESHEDFRHENLIHQFWNKLMYQNGDILSLVLDRVSDKLYVKANLILHREIPDQYFGQSFHEIRERGFAGFAHYFLFMVLDGFDEMFYTKKIPFIKTKLTNLFELIDIDENYEVSFGETIWAAWKLLTKTKRNEKFLRSILRKSNTPYAEASLIMLKFKSKENFSAGFHINTPTHLVKEHKSEVNNKFSRRSAVVLSGYQRTFRFTAAYLDYAFNEELGVTSAGLSEIDKLVKLDLKTGVPVAEILYNCCLNFPRRDALEIIVANGTAGLSNQEIKTLAAEIFACGSADGLNCLNVIFQLVNRISRCVQPNLAGPIIQNLVPDIEKSFDFLMTWGQENDVDMIKVLNTPWNDGNTFLARALVFSPHITSVIIDRGVKVNSIDCRFITPFMKVILFFWLNLVFFA